jgi:hypothetical protein
LPIRTMRVLAVMWAHCNHTPSVLAIVRCSRVLGNCSPRVRCPLSSGGSRFPRAPQADEQADRGQCRSSPTRPLFTP